MGLNITDSRWYKVMMPKLYGWGAALVIIGALFKIEHWQYSSEFLIAGLGTEAIIFFFRQYHCRSAISYKWDIQNRNA